MNFEFTILDFIQNHMRSGFMDVFMKTITKTDDSGGIWLVLAVLLIISARYRKTGLTVILALGIEILLCGKILKPLIGRVRPCDINTGIQLLIGNPGGYSFPSGHAASSFTAVSVLYSDRFRWRRCFLVLAILISFSRIYLYVHFATDVIAGAILGFAIGKFSCAMMEKVIRMTTEKNPERGNTI